MADDDDDIEEGAGDDEGGEGGEADTSTPEADPYAEINELKQKLGLLQKTKEAQRERYKKEMQMLLNPLLLKHKEVQRENSFLRQQIQQLMGEGDSNDDFLSDLKHTIEDQKKEISILKNMVRQMEQQQGQHHHQLAELTTLRDMIAEKDDLIQELESKQEDLLFTIEAKEDGAAKLAVQVSNLEADIFKLNKKLKQTQDKSPQTVMDEEQVAEIAALKQQVIELEAQAAKWEAQAAKWEAQVANTMPVADEVEDPYQDAMEMLLQELRSNVSTYDDMADQIANVVPS